MTFDEFCARVKIEIKGVMPAESKILIQDVMKNNGAELKGLIVVTDSVNISPTIYLEPYYEKYMRGELFYDVLDEIVDVYEEHKQSENFDISIVKDWEKAKNNIICKLVNYDLNKELLKTVPHKQVEDLAVVYMISVSDFKDEFATVLIQDHILSFYENKTVDDLDEVSRKNIKRICPPQVKDMQTILENFTGTEVPLGIEPQMHVLTNEQQLYGAIHISE